MNVGLFEKGWECPKCGAVMSPYESVCVNCRGHSGTTIITNEGSIINQEFFDTKDGADNER